MSRKARKVSSSNIYHVMVRGVNRQKIFEESRDYEKFLYILKDYQEECNFTVYAYCLMGNHFHILARFEGDPIGKAMKKINTKYVCWFNSKYDRVGHLFQDRFKSQPVEDERYFLTCVRYIHQNPVKAEVAEIDQYEYSSYNDYLGWKKNDLVDTSFLYSSIDRKQFLEMHKEFCDNDVVDIETNRNWFDDDEVRKIIFELTKCNTVAEFQELDKIYRKVYLKELKNRGVGIGQLSRLTGESKYIIRKV